MTELRHCPSCQFDKEAWLKYVEDMQADGYVSHQWEDLKPQIEKSILLGQPIVNCNRCGFQVIFANDSEEEIIDMWNELPRTPDNDVGHLEAQHRAAKVNQEAKALLQKVRIMMGKLPEETNTFDLYVEVAGFLDENDKTNSVS